MDQQKQRAEIISMNLNRPGVIHLIEGQEVTLGKSQQNTNPILDDRIAPFHCSLFFQDGQFVLKNLCQQGTYLNHEKMGNNMEVNLTHGDHIHLLMQKGKKVTEKHVVAYMFLQYENKKPSVKKSSKCSQSAFEQIGDDLICIICFELYYEAVTVSPCGHVFCGFCLQEWIDNNETCPLCRKNIRKVIIAFQINKIVQTVIELNPEIEVRKKPVNVFYDFPDQDESGSSSEDSSSDSDSDSDIELNDRIYGDQQIRRQGFNQQQIGLLAVNPAPNQQRVQPPQRNNEHLQIQNNGGQVVPQVNLPQNRIYTLFECQSCLEEYKGFKCNQQYLFHRYCWSCSKILPKRDLNTYQNADLKLFCQICKKSYCQFYYGECKYRGLSSLKEFSHYRAEFNINHKYINPTERTRIQNHLGQQDQTYIFDFIMNRYITQEQFYYKQNKTLFWDEEIEINELLLPNSPVCNKCIIKVMSQMIFRYATKEIQFVMPDCWYGINCKRQQQEIMHTRKYNHMCKQTKFD